MNVVLPCVAVLHCTAGTADQDVASYLSGLQSEAEGLLMGGKGAAAEAAVAAVAAAAAEMEEAGDVPDAPVVAELGRRPLNYGPKDVLEGMANEEAIAARRVVKGLKLSREELGQELLPEVRGKWQLWCAVRGD
jgi:hypothetical protein